MPRDGLEPSQHLCRGILSVLSPSFQGARTISLPSTLLVKVVGVLCWLLRGLNLSSSLYTFTECIQCLARDRHFTGSPELTHSLLTYFYVRGTGFLVLPCVYQISPSGQILFVCFKERVNFLTYANIIYYFSNSVNSFLI